MDTPGDIGPGMPDDGAESEPPERLTFEVVVEAGDWSAAGNLEALASGIARVMAEDEAVAAEIGGPASACLAFTSDSEVRTLNARYRAKDAPTNVLSFPAGAHPAQMAGAGEPRPLGDVILAAGTVAAEAAEQGLPLAHHVQHLVVHGVLHLLGHDHQTDAEAGEMEAHEIRLLAALGVPDPYRSSE